MNSEPPASASGWRAAFDTINELAAPVTRAGAYYAHSWYRWFAKPQDGHPPPTRPKMRVAAQAAVDEAVLVGARFGRRPRNADEYARVEREVNDALALYASRGWIEKPARFHNTPTAPVGYSTSRARLGHPDAEHLRFESGYEPHPGEPGRERWNAQEANRTVHAWVLRHKTPRPWIVCVHGAAMGVPQADLRVFRAAWMHETLGMNVVLPVMPRHGPRREGRPFGVGFPDDDLLDTVHAVAQAVWDVRSVIAWVRDQSDEPVGLHGLSLGAYVASIVAGLESDLACVIAGVPVVDFTDLFERHAPNRFRNADHYDRLSSLATAVNRVAAPLSFEPLVPLDRRFIYAGIADRLIDPLRQVAPLWNHWGQPRIHWFEGSHVGFFFARPVRGFIEEALMLSGLGTVAAPE